MTVQTIVLGADGSENSHRAVQFAADLARQLGARVVAVHAFDPLALLGTVEPPVDFEQLERDTQQRLEAEWCAPLRDAGVSFTAEVVENTPVGALVDAAAAHAADLVVIGARGHTPVRQLVLGSTSLRLPHGTKRPVTIVP
ncbi:MAG TPA: universal stress protein [Acidimicrobiia bacterium]|nr:universal stress protein [Acidimicrobiia bacterium]